MRRGKVSERATKSVDHWMRLDYSTPNTTCNGGFWFDGNCLGTKMELQEMDPTTVIESDQHLELYFLSAEDALL